MKRNSKGTWTVANIGGQRARIDSIIEAFDFKKAHKVLLAGGFSEATVERLKSTARELLESVFEGALEATCYGLQADRQRQQGIQPGFRLWTARLRCVPVSSYGVILEVYHTQRKARRVRSKRA